MELGHQIFFASEASCQRPDHAIVVAVWGSWASHPLPLYPAPVKIYEAQFRHLFVLTLSHILNGVYLRGLLMWFEGA